MLRDNPSYNSQSIIHAISDRLVEEGFKGQVVSVDHVVDLQSEIVNYHSKGLLDSTFYTERLTHFDFNSRERIPNPASIIITAAPQPQQQVIFVINGAQHEVIVPPTYSYETDDKVAKVLRDVLNPYGFDVYPTILPEKLLAVHSGLAEYGKNNITYIEGIGSFYRLKAFLSDLPPSQDSWVQLRSMQQCDNCVACIKKCPTNAITSGRFLIYAEKCLTFHNEKENDFPNWIDPSWHNCLIGCMHCQTVCPVNKRFFKWYEQKLDFSQEETELILGQPSRSQLPPATADKIKQLYLLDDFELVSRNLRTLLNRG